jgi:hypothetical protein
LHRAPRPLPVDLLESGAKSAARSAIVEDKTKDRASRERVEREREKEPAFSDIYFGLVMAPSEAD